MLHEVTWCHEHVANHSGDFTVQFSHSSKSDVSIFKLLYHMTTLMLGRSTRLQEEKVKSNKVIINTIYRRILWSKYLCVLPKVHNIHVRGYSTSLFILYCSAVMYSCYEVFLFNRVSLICFMALMVAQNCPCIASP